jgi:hypothetical protein
MAGYWTGRASGQDSNRTQDAVALINEAGDAQLMVLSSQDDRQFVLFGNVCCEATFDDDVAGRRFRDDRNQAASVKVTRDGDGLSGELEFRGDSYTLQLSAAPDYAQALTLQQLSGTYSRSSFFSSSLTLTIDAEGRLTGSDSNGCIMNGNVSIADPGRNMVRMRVDMENCRNGHGSSREWNGSYNGLGLLLRAGDDQREDVFFHSMIGPTWLGPQSVAR